MGKYVRIIYMWDLFKQYKFFPETDLYIYVSRRAPSQDRNSDIIPFGYIRAENKLITSMD